MTEVKKTGISYLEVEAEGEDDVDGNHDAEV
jgi:hypothetical protein